MRTIKFRGKDVFTDAWRYGDLVHNKKVTTTGLEPRTMVGGYEVDPETVGNNTGLKDKNGKEVYEGDVLRSDKYPYNCRGKDNYFMEVYWSEYDCRMELVIHKNPQAADVPGIYDLTREKLTLNFARTLEVIGNIYDRKNEGLSISSKMESL